jgi:hypothetical protein
MGSERAARAGFVIRAFNGAEDAAGVAGILREAREAASWPEETLQETVKLPGVSAFISERNGDFGDRGWKASFGRGGNPQPGSKARNAAAGRGAIVGWPHPPAVRRTSGKSRVFRGSRVE